MNTRLNQKQELFLVEYLKGASITDAALKAGYAPKYASRSGWRTLNSPLVKERLAELRKEIESDAVMNVQERMELLTEIARAKPEDILKISEDKKDAELTAEALKSPAVAYIRTEQKLIGRVMPVRVTKVGLIDKVKAIDTLNKMDKIYSDNAQINIDNRKVIFQIGKGYADNDQLDLPTDKQNTE